MTKEEQVEKPPYWAKITHALAVALPYGSRRQRTDIAEAQYVYHPQVDTYFWVDSQIRNLSILSLWSRNEEHESLWDPNPNDPGLRWKFLKLPGADTPSVDDKARVHFEEASPMAYLKSDPGTNPWHDIVLPSRGGGHHLYARFANNDVVDRYTSYPSIFSGKSELALAFDCMF